MAANKRGARSKPRLNLSLQSKLRGIAINENAKTGFWRNADFFRLIQSAMAPIGVD
jgi:hypothetical protein